MATLANIIASIESSDNPKRLRFESATYQKLISGKMTPIHSVIVGNIASINKCSTDTAAMLYSTSFGLYQMMGFNLWDPSSSARTSFDVFSFVASPNEQTRCFNAFVSRETIDYTAQELADSDLRRVHFAHIYNGDAEHYSAAIVGALKIAGYKVI